MKIARIAPLVIALIGSVLYRNQASGSESSPKLAPLDLARQLNQAFVQVARSVSPAVVVIKVAHPSGWTELEHEESPYWDLIPRQFRKRMEEELEKRRQEEEQGNRPKREPVFNSEGSGFVIRKEGYILTNRHVVDGAEKILVVLRDGTEFVAEVRGVDAQSDVAVLKIDPRGVPLTAATLGDSDKTQVGEFAIAIGAPYELEYSVTFGHVSAKGRGHILSDPTMDQDFIQTDANVNPGNSGGPLVNIEGEVIGINTLIRGLRTGIAFAIPSNLARAVADQLIREGRFVRAYLGVQIKALREDAELRRRLKGLSEGVVITAILPDGPAAKSELRPEDIITAVGDVPVATPQELRTQIRSKPIGQDIALKVHRDGQNLVLKVKAESWPDLTTPVFASRGSGKSTEKSLRFGLTVEVLTADLARQFDVEPCEGVIVIHVAVNSDAERKDLRPGDIITEVNQQNVQTPSQFHEAIEIAKTKKSVVLNYTRDGKSKSAVLGERSGE